MEAHRGVMVILLAAMAQLGRAASPYPEVLTADQYFDCQIAAREASLEGMRERLKLQGKVNTTAAEKRRSDEVARGRVTLAMRACGKQTASTLGAYAHRNSEELRTWLVAHPHIQARLADLRRQVTALSDQMQAVSPSAKR
jgi:hypothetical protein